MVRISVIGLFFVYFFIGKASGACEWFPGEEVVNCEEGGDGRLAFQSDGNLVIYDGKGTSIWASDTRPCGRRAIFQKDGNLVVFNRGGKIVYSTATTGLGNRMTFSQGKLTIYDTAYQTAWTSSDFWRKKGCCDANYLSDVQECTGGGPVGRK
ncbi:Comitin [Folsomia candida]|uniref:Comitin n=1 Tax=Folsomia candida TaxID=158441 RepID=A0A226D851_FOLCA|nr:Comitin [Folsomia candida]